MILQLVSVFYFNLEENTTDKYRWVLKKELLSVFLGV